ncbi:MAG TPA: isocitrate dehydrogenase kinase/phosphatase AceK regulatory subunit, partial [Gemmatimonadales bacterium]|nr:isocitrate dehydrogenase kinase/phosphatase AceK regulatory subunit [Gemmatimonadales bacterium]
MRYRGLESTLNLAGSPPGDKRSVETRAADAIFAAYEGWRQGFEEITGRARERFERRDWRGAQADAT